VQVVVSPAARDDIRTVYSYYAERNPDAAGRVVRVITTAIGGLAQYPLMGRSGVKPGTRGRMLSRYPYKIIYEINGDTVEVDRVLHTARQWP
jgi:plasmid stabilization system protein ParE